jgi:hypothetical protein
MNAGPAPRLRQLRSVKMETTRNAANAFSEKQRSVIEDFGLELTLVDDTRIEILRWTKEICHIAIALFLSGSEDPLRADRVVFDQ